MIIKVRLLPSIWFCSLEILFWLDICSTCSLPTVFALSWTYHRVILDCLKDIGVDFERIGLYLDVWRLYGGTHACAKIFLLWFVVTDDGLIWMPGIELSVFWQSSMINIDLATLFCREEIATLGSPSCRLSGWWCILRHHNSDRRFVDRSKQCIICFWGGGEWLAVAE